MKMNENTDEWCLIILLCINACLYKGSLVVELPSPRFSGKFCNQYTQEIYFIKYDQHRNSFWFHKRCVGGVFFSLMAPSTQARYTGNEQGPPLKASPNIQTNPITFTFTNFFSMASVSNTHESNHTNSCCCCCYSSHPPSPIPPHSSLLSAFSKTWKASQAPHQKVGLQGLINLEIQQRNKKKIRNEKK